MSCSVFLVYKYVVFLVLSLNCTEATQIRGRTKQQEIRQNVLVQQLHRHRDLGSGVDMDS
jgi:hypothetical protein